MRMFDDVGSVLFGFEVFARHMLGWLNNSKRVALRADKATNTLDFASGVVRRDVDRMYDNKEDVSNAGNSMRMGEVHFGLQCAIFAGAN